MIKKVTYPDFVTMGIRALNRSTPNHENLRLFSADTETVKGQPHYLTATDGQDILASYVTATDIFETFVQWALPRCKVRGMNICYFHVLNFDTLVLLVEKRKAIYQQGSKYAFEYKKCEIEGLHGKVNALTIHREGKTLKILDSYAFTTASLARSLSMFKVSAEKLDKPKGLGEFRFDRFPLKHPDRLYFERYSLNDTTALHKLAVRIMEFHREYSVTPCISLPQFAARVLRRHFLKPGEVIQFPPLECVRASELSYHGGKNWKDDTGPIVVENAYEADISSAFPYAMSLLPQMVKGNYLSVRKYNPSLPGIYKVSGHDHGRYPLIFDHAFKPTREFSDTWITGHELSRALKSPDIKLSVSDGWIWVPDRSYKHNALAEYVHHFYKLKESTSKDDPRYNFFKLMLNGAYGKFGQAVAVAEKIWLEDPDADIDKIPIDYIWDDVVGDYVEIAREHRAGGLYNPFIATQITGHTRAYLYDLETKYGAFHAATDAIKTTSRVPPKKGLGGIKLETFGRCYCFRNKLYLHYAKSSKFCGHDLNAAPDKYWVRHREPDGQHLCKYGLHGFKGSLDELVFNKHSLIKGKPLKYEYNHMIRLREGLKRKEDVCAMVSRPEVLDLLAPRRK